MHINSCTWIDGSPADALPLDDRGLQYGDGLFETIRVVGGVMPLEAWHYRRLFRSCQRLALSIDKAVLQAQVADFLRERSDGILKILITRGSGGRGYNPAGASPRIILRWFASASRPASWVELGVEVKLCRTLLGHSPALAGMKHLNRLEQVLARAEWQDPDIAEGLMFDMAGHLVEGTMSNLFLVTSGQIVTPDLSLCGVAGVVRQWLLDSPQFDITVGQLSRDDLFQADEVFLSNSVLGVWPVRKCEQHSWSPGPVTRSVQQAVQRIMQQAV